MAAGFDLVTAEDSDDDDNGYTVSTAE